MKIITVAFKRGSAINLKYKILIRLTTECINSHKNHVLSPSWLSQLEIQSNQIHLPDQWTDLLIPG